MINFLLGFSISINFCLVAFLVFVFKKQESKIYEKFDEKVDVIKDNNDPFNKL